MKNRITIGISSMIFIFSVLCIAVFCLLSLSDARSALSFAERHASSVQIYYDADAKAQKLICDYRRLYKTYGNISSCLDEILTDIPDESSIGQNERGNITLSIPMESGQTLFSELSPDGEQIFSYYVYNSSEYIIDTSLPIWGGND